MPKYTYTSKDEAAAIVLPTKPRIVLDVSVETEVPQDAHDKLVGHKIIGALIKSGVIRVEGAKAPKAPTKAEKEAEAKFKAAQEALTQKGIEFDKDATVEQLEALIAQSESAQ